MSSFKHILYVACSIVFIQVHAQNTINLQGQWEFQQGESSPTATYNDQILLPGSMLTNGKGNIVSVRTQWTGSLYDSSFYFNPYMERYRVEGQMKFPFFLTPSKQYVGTAWYRKVVNIPKTWKNKRVILYLERPHIETNLFINNVEVGHQMSLSVPHEFDITPYVKIGEENTIAIKVYNGIENVCVGQDSHSVTDQTQGNWNGVIGKMELQAKPKCFIERINVYPDAAHHKANIRLYMNDYVPQKGQRKLKGRSSTFTHVVAELMNSDKRHVVRHEGAMFFGKKDSNGYIDIELDMTDSCHLWSEFNPEYYQLTVIYAKDTVRTTFGMRDISIKERQFYLNGDPIWMRGTVENCCFPATGYPPTDVEEWLRIFRKCKEYGLNHVRFHSYCPPEAAFIAADQVGMYLQPEGPSWPNHGVKLRRGMAIDQYLMDEGKAMLDQYGNHPSFVMMAAGNEPAGDWVPYCRDWVKAMHEYDPTKVYCGASVGGGWAWDFGSEYHVKGGARGLDWDRNAPSSSDDYYSGIEFPRNYKDSLPNQTPIIAHEQGQWCAFPDFKEISQYEGCAYQPGNFEIFRDLLHDNGMESQAEKFLHASGKLQVLAYKYEMERNLRTKDYAGFQLLALNDYSGQGTALVGPLNVFWREKGYVNAKEWRESCSPTVIFAQFPKFVFANKEQLSIPIELYQTIPQHPSSTFRLQYAIEGMDKQGTIWQGKLPMGKNIRLGEVNVSLAQIQRPTKLTLLLRLWQEGTSQPITNHYDFWVYPDILDSSEFLDNPKGIYVSDTLDSKALNVLAQGGKVLITAAGKVRFGNDVRHTYLPVFWNTSWFKMRPPHTTGAYIQKEHPLFKEFPTDDWQELHWWELVNRTQVMNLAEFPSDYQPIVQPIDTWHVSRKLGMLIEANVLKGKLLMTTMDITNDLDRRLVARQMRYAILRYMASEDFQPTAIVSPDVISHLFEREAPKVNMFTNDSPDELKPKLTP
ncbi:MAG: beta-glucuronidase [Prevotella sp.]|nr:beta-glucuronidase [Prevotella sp.]